MRWGLKGLLGDILHSHPHAMSRTNGLKGSITSRISQVLSYTLGRANNLGVSMIFEKIGTKSECIHFHLEAPKLCVPEIASLDAQLRSVLGWVNFIFKSLEIAKVLTFAP